MSQNNHALTNDTSAPQTPEPTAHLMAVPDKPTENTAPNHEPYESLPTLAQLLTDLDPKHTTGRSYFREALADLRAVLTKWWVWQMLVIGILGVYGVFMYSHHRKDFYFSMVSVGIMVLSMDLMLSAVLSLGGLYKNFSNKHVVQVENDIARETLMIDRVKHIPPAALRRLRKRLIVEINFIGKAKIGTTVVAVFALVSGLGVHNLPIGSAEWYKQTPNIPIIVAVGCFFFLEGVLLRQTRKYMRLVHVLKCAEGYSSR